MCSRRFFTGVLALSLLICGPLSSIANINIDSANKMVQQSVTVRADGSQGSGVLITRMVKINGKLVKRTFVLTCAHVVDSMVKKDKSGNVTYGKPKVEQQISRGGIIVGKKVYNTKIVYYSSEKDRGHDLALLMITNGVIDQNVEFFDGIPVIGVDVWHVGTPRGMTQSLTDGIISVVGRVLMVTDSYATYFDQACVSALPGSSGGGVFFEDGKLMGLVARQVDDNFNFIIPARRIKAWADSIGASWIYDSNLTSEVKNDEQTENTIVSK